MRNKMRMTPNQQTNWQTNKLTHRICAIALPNSFWAAQFKSQNEFKIVVLHMVSNTWDDPRQDS